MSKNIVSKRKTFFIIMLIITGLYIAFIWWHSTMTAEKSATESLTVLSFIKNIFKAIGINSNLTDHIIRKSAHFCEFALLGCLTTWTAYAGNHRIVKNLMSTGFVCLGTAVIDELVQISAKGRSAEVTDVALDFCGAVAGFLFFILIFAIVRLIRKAK